MKLGGIFGDQVIETPVADDSLWMRPLVLRVAAAVTAMVNFVWAVKMSFIDHLILSGWARIGVLAFTSMGTLMALYHPAHPLRHAIVLALHMCQTWWFIVLSTGSNRAYLEWQAHVQNNLSANVDDALFSARILRALASISAAIALLTLNCQYQGWLKNHYIEHIDQQTKLEQSQFLEQVRRRSSHSQSKVKASHARAELLARQMSSKMKMTSRSDKEYCVASSYLPDVDEIDNESMSDQDMSWIQRRHAKKVSAADRLPKVQMDFRSQP